MRPAACLPCAALTAWVGLNDQTLLTNANTVLLQRTGGVSIFGLKLADAVGASVIITSSSNEKLARASRLVKKKDDGSVGFSNDFLTINYAQEPQWEEIALAHTRGKGGVDIILENGGTATLIASMKTVRKKGTISQIGYLGRQVTADLIPGFLPLLIDKAIRLRGINFGSRPDFQNLMHFVQDHQMSFDDIIDRKFKFEEAGEAFKYLASGSHFGKVVIQVT